MTEDAARVAALESGQADVINNVPVHDVPRLERSPKARIEKVEGLRMFFLALNPALSHLTTSSSVRRSTIRWTRRRS